MSESTAAGAVLLRADAERAVEVWCDMLDTHTRTIFDRSDYKRFASFLDQRGYLDQETCTQRFDSRNAVLTAATDDLWGQFGAGSPARLMRSDFERIVEVLARRDFFWVGSSAANDDWWEGDGDEEW